MFVRLATGLGVLAAFPFLASGVSQASIAGANPLTTTNRPDIRTIHVNQAFDQATFCFDKTLSNQGFGGNPIAPGKFFLSGYRFDTAAPLATAGVQSSNTSCIVGTVVPKTTYGGSRDLASYTIGSVAPQTVIANAGGSAAPGNLGDATPNLDSNAKSGTTDHTTGPDLQAVLPPDTTNNQMVFVFDQPVRNCGGASNCAAFAQGVGRFVAYDQNGLPHFGWPVGVDNAGDVLVQFCTGAGQPATLIPPGFTCGSADSVSTFVRTTVTRTNTPATTGKGLASCTTSPFGCTNEGEAANETGAVQEQAGDPQTFNPVESVTVPGTAGITARPSLTSAAIVQASGNATNQIDYTFDAPISSGNPAACTAVMSNGQEIQGDSESIIAANTVRVTFSTAGLQNFQELAVKASVSGIGGAGTCAVGVNTIAGAHPFNTVGGVAIGDNAGAAATGFTTGPDFGSVTFNTTNGTVTLQADQRINPATVTTAVNRWTLIANDGTVITSTPQSAAVVNNAPYQSQVVLTFLTNELQRATAIQVAGPPLCGNDSAAFAAPAAFTFGGGAFTPQGTVCQVLSPTASGVAFHDPAKGKVHIRWHRLHVKAHRSHRHHAAYKK
jgi:hypothetical protein